MKTLKDLCIYGIIIPIVVVLLADLAITISCKYYWGEHVLNFKLSIWQINPQHLLERYLLSILYSL